MPPILRRVDLVAAKALLFLQKKKPKNSCLLGVGAAERDTPRLSDRGGSVDCFPPLSRGSQ
jgi:hypothetical protein